MIPRDQACSGRGGPGRSQECVNAVAPLVILVGHDPVDRIPDDRRKGHMPVARLSAQASHLGNVAYLEKRRIKFDPAREQILPL